MGIVDDVWGTGEEEKKKKVAGTSLVDSVWNSSTPASSEKPDDSLWGKMKQGAEAVRQLAFGEYKPKPYVGEGEIKEGGYWNNVMASVLPDSTYARAKPQNEMVPYEEYAAQTPEQKAIGQERALKSGQGQARIHANNVPEEPSKPVFDIYKRLRGVSVMDPDYEQKKTDIKFANVIAPAIEDLPLVLSKNPLVGMGGKLAIEKMVGRPPSDEEMYSESDIERNAMSVLKGVEQAGMFFAGAGRRSHEMLEKNFKPVIGQTTGKNFGSFLLQGPVTLGTAGVMENIVEISKAPTIEEKAAIANRTLIENSAMGLVFTAASLGTPAKIRRIMQNKEDMYTTSGKIADAVSMVGLGILGDDLSRTALSGKAHGLVAAATGEEDERSLEQKVADYGTTALFVLAGGKGIERLREIARVSGRSDYEVLKDAVQTYESNPNKYKDQDILWQDVQKQWQDGTTKSAEESAKTFENAMPLEGVKAERKYDAAETFQRAFDELKNKPNATADEILAVWRSIDMKDPGMEGLIKSLADKDKVELAKGAMRGEIPTWFETEKMKWNMDHPEAKIGETAKQDIQPEMKRSDMDAYIQKERQKYYDQQKPEGYEPGKDYPVEKGGVTLDAGGGLRYAWEWFEKQSGKAIEKLFPRGITRYKDADIVRIIKDQTRKELGDWNEKYKKDYHGFYDKDIEITNQKVQDYAKKNFGRELTPDEISLFHIASAFGSPTNRPPQDTSLGLQILHRYIKTGDLSSQAFDKSKKWGTGEGDIPPEYDYGQISMRYNTKGLGQVKKLIDKMGLKGAMEWMRTWHSREEIAQVLGKDPKSLHKHEYMDKDGGLGVFGLTGAKLGSYILNRTGNLSTVTKDMWYARTMARYAGQKLHFYDRDSGTNKPIEKPWGHSAKEQRLRNLADQAWKELAQERGVEPAIIQQEMWDYEKSLWEDINEQKRPKTPKEESMKAQSKLFGEEGEKGRTGYYPSEGIAIGEKKIEKLKDTHPELRFGPFQPMWEGMMEGAGKVVDKIFKNSSKESTKDSIRMSWKSGDISKDSPIRMTDVDELRNILKTGRLSEGQDFEGRSGISAQVPGTNKEPVIVGYGKNNAQSVAIVYPKEAIIGKGEAPNEVKIDPRTSPKDLKYIVDGKVKTWDELSKTHTDHVHEQTLKNKGATYSLREGDIKEGYSVSMHKERENAKHTLEEFKKDKNILADYIADNMDLLEKPGKALGTWVREDGKVVMDVTEVKGSLQEAKAIGRKHDQDAIYNLKTGDTIPIRKTEKFRYDHYSTTEGLDKLSPEKAYSGAGGSEKAYGEYPEFDTKGSYLYKEGDTPEHFVTSRAKAKYKGEIEGDFLELGSKEHKSISEEARKYVLEHADEYGAANEVAMNAKFQDLVKNKYGYDGIKSEKGLKSFKDVPIESEHKLSGEQVRKIDPDKGPALGFLGGGSGIISKAWDAFVQKIFDKVMRKDVEMGKKVVRDYNAIMEFFNPGMTLKDADQWLEARGLAKGRIEKATGLIKALQDKYGNLTPQAKEDIWHALNGDRTINSLPADLQPAARRLRTVDNVLGRMLLKSGIIDRQTYDSWQGRHIKHIYSLFAEDYNSGIAGSAIKFAPFSKRTVQSDRVRERLGLIKDPVEAITQQILEVTKAASMHDYFVDIASNQNFVYKPSLITVDYPTTLGPGRAEKKSMGIGAAQKLLDKYLRLDDPNPEQKAFIRELKTKIAASEANVDKIHKEFTQLNGERYGMLDGAYVHKTIANDIRPVFEMSIGDHEGLQKIGKALVAAQGLWKMKNVALNVPTMSRNVISNMIQLNMSGMNLPEVALYLSKAVNHYAKGSAEWKMAQKQGLFSGNFSAGELNEITGIINDMQSSSLSKILKGAQKLGSYYGKIDDVFKLAKFLHAKEEGMSNAKAAQEAQKWGMDYSLVAPSIKKIRNIPMGTPFISYQYKIAPLIVESLTKRPWVIAKYLAIPAILQSMVTKDLSEEDAKKFMQDLPEYIKDGQVFMIPGKHGMNALDVSYLVPWGNWWQIATAAKNGRIWQMGQQLGLNRGLLPTLLYGITTGKDLFTGEDITSPVGKYNTKVKVKESLQWIANMILPPMLSPTYGLPVKIAEHVQHGQTKQGQKTEGMNVWPRAAGVNIYPLNPKSGEIEKMKDIKAVRNQILKQLSDRNLSDEERDEIKKVWKYTLEMIKNKE